MSGKESELEKMSDKLLLQLHEQYAINNNSSMGAVVSLLVSMFAAIGAYGYVWTQCGLNSKSFGMADLTFAAIGASFILLVMSYICMYQGTTQRLEQFITYKIRKKYEIIGFFPKGYEPFSKKGLDIVQGLYGEFVKIFLFVLLFIVTSFLFKLYELQRTQWDWTSVIMVCVGVLVYLVLVLLFLFQNIRRYKRRCQVCLDSKFGPYDAEDYEPFNCCFVNMVYSLYEKMCDVCEKCK